MDEIITTPPKSVQLADILRREILSGKLRKGDRLQPSRRIAEIYSVTNQIAQSAFDILRKEGLIDSHVGQGTFVASSGKSLLAKSVLVLLQGTQDKHNRLPIILSSILQKHGYIPYVFDTEHSHEAATVANVKALLAEQPLACVANAYGDFNFALLDAVSPATRLVLVNHVERDRRYPAASEVLIDFVETGRRACEHLLEKGRRRIAAVTFERRPGWSSDLMLTGVEKALSARRLKLFKCLDGHCDEAVFTRDFALRGCPDGVFCLSDNYIVRVRRAADACGLVLGKDYDAIGNGDTPWAEAYGIASMDRMDAEVAAKVVESIESDVKVRVSIPATLALRQEASQAACVILNQSISVKVLQLRCQGSGFRVQLSRKDKDLRRRPETKIGKYKTGPLAITSRWGLKQDP